MANRDAIMNALGEAREHLILGKYNDAMMLMAQITIDVVEHLTDEALIVSKGYEEDLKTLKAVGVLADDTAHNFETLIVSGVQAHNGVDIPKEHAEQALQVLTNEIDLIFKNSDSIPPMAENLDEKAKFNSENENSTIFEYDEEDDANYPGDFSRDVTTDGATPAFLQKEDDTDFRKKEKMREQLLAGQRKKRVKHKKTKLIAIIIPIFFVLFFVFGVRAIFFSGGDIKRNATRIDIPTTIESIETSETETTEPETTTPPPPPEAGFYIVTGDLVKIRNSPTTEGSKVYAQANRGDRVSVKSFYNNEWAIITYDGNEAYIARRYIERDTALSPVTTE